MAIIPGVPLHLRTKIRPYRKCEHCKQWFRPKASEVRRGNGRFCNKSCAAKFVNRQRKLQRDPGA